MPQATARERKQGKHCYWEFGSGTSTIMNHHSPKAITTVTAPVREDNIRQGHGNQLHPKWADALQISSPQKERALKWPKMQYQKERTKWLCSCLFSFFRKLYLWSFRMEQSLSAHGPLGASCCWKSSRPPAAKLAFQNEMANVAAFCHREGYWGVFHVVSRHHLLVVGMGSSRSARTQR